MAPPLHFSYPHELAIAVILSAQCTDERVNQVTPALFKKYPDIESFSRADIKDLEQLIFSTGFYKNKAKSIKGFAEKLIKLHQGILPQTISELTQLPGVGRKTANVILNIIYNISEGVVVDTHVKRISARLGLTVETDPVKIERDLMKKIRKDYWDPIALYLIFLGRSVCTAYKTECGKCVLGDICPTAKMKS